MRQLSSGGPLSLSDAGFYLYVTEPEHPEQLQLTLKGPTAQSRRIRRLASQASQSRYASTISAIDSSTRI